MSKDKRDTKVVRITKKVYEQAIKAKGEEYDYMDTQSWLSFLIIKGLEKLSDDLREKLGEIPRHE